MRLRGYWRVCSGLVAFWMVCAVLGTTAFWTTLQLGSVRMQGDSSLPALVRLQGVPWLAAALLTPAAVYWSFLLTPVRGGWRRAVAGHLAGAMLFGVLDTLLSITLHQLLQGRLFTFEMTSVLSRLAGSAVLIVTKYGCIVGVTGAYVAFQRAAEEHRASEHLAAIRAGLERDLATVRLMVLRQQLQPHFLFNALNAVSGLIDESPERARRLLANLGDLLRLVLRRSADTHATLGDELDFADRFLDIERERLGERLTVRYEIAERLLGVRLPSFAVQPLVENAVRHGIARLERGGTVVIAAAQRDASLEVTVSNDLPPDAADGTEGVGLGGLRARLTGMYGDAARLQTTIADRRFRAIMTVPMETV